MHLYEEYQEYETLWNKPSQPAIMPLEEDLDNPPLVEGLLLTIGTWALNFITDLLLLVLKAVIETPLTVLAGATASLATAVTKLIEIAWSAIISAIRVSVFAFSVVEEVALLALSSVIRGVKVAIEEAVTPLFEDLDEDAKTDALTRALAKFKFDDLAQKDPELKKDLQNFYSEAGPEQAQKILSDIEIQIQQQAGSLAESLKDVKPEDLEANKDKIIKRVKKQFEKERRKLQKANSQGKA